MAIKQPPLGPHQAYPPGGILVESPLPGAHRQVVTAPAAATISPVAIASSDAVTAAVDAYALPTATIQTQLSSYLMWAAVGSGLWWAWKNRTKIAAEARRFFK